MATRVALRAGKYRRGVPAIKVPVDEYMGEVGGGKGIWRAFDVPDILCCGPLVLARMKAFTLIASIALPL